MTTAPARPVEPVRHTRAALAVTIAGLAVFNVARSTVLPDGWDLGANVAMAFAVAAVAWWAAATATELGLARATWGRGLAYGAVAFGIVTAVLVLAAAVPATRGLFDDDRAQVGGGALLFEVLVSVPLGTVLLEELAFRGLLLALFHRLGSTVAAVAWSSVLFGLWHIAPAITSSGENAAASEATGSLLATVLVTVAATTVAGVVFCWLRLRSGSLLAPMLAHLATNTVAFTVAWVLAR